VGGQVGLAAKWDKVDAEVNPLGDGSGEGGTDERVGQRQGRHVGEPKRIEAFRLGRRANRSERPRVRWADTYRDGKAYLHTAQP
jgi:hypothetical protein